MNKKEVEDELRGLIKNGDCPQELLDLLESKPKLWRIAVAKQFIEQYNWRVRVESAISKIRWRQGAVLGILVPLLILMLKVAIYG